MTTQASAQLLTDSAVPDETPQPLLCPDHYKELASGSAISEGLIKLNFRSTADSKEIAKFLGWKDYRHAPGWIVQGIDPETGEVAHFGQFKPDSKLVFPDGQEAKYLTPKCQYEAICLQVEAADYWQKVLADPTIPIRIAEGGKKAGCSLSHQPEMPCIAIAGTEMGAPKGKRGIQLTPLLEKFAVRGRPVELCFDADLVSKVAVQEALIYLAAALKKKGCVVTVRVWDAALGKGLDDVVAQHGWDVFMAQSEEISYKTWLQRLEQQVSPRLGDGKKPPTPNQLEKEIAEEYQAKWIFDNDRKTWRNWNGKFWEPLENRAFRSRLKKVIDGKHPHYSGPTYISNCLELLTDDLLEEHWKTADKKRYINANNGVYDLLEGKLFPHAPGFRFTSVLPHNISAGLDLSAYSSPIEALKQLCPHTYAFMATAMKGDSQKILKLLAIINAVLKWRWGKELQMFVQLVGRPGTGKGTFARLLQEVVGVNNFEPIKGQQLGDGSHIARIISKQLVTFPDERKSIEAIDWILSLTGNDAIAYRDVYKPSASGFFEGCIVILCNNPIFIGDTTGIERRLSLVWFDHLVPVSQRNSVIEDKMKAEIESLIPIALSVPDATITDLIRGTGNGAIADFRAREWEMKCEVDSVAHWMNEQVIFDAAPSHTQIGNADSAANTLYGNYLAFCSRANIKQPFATKGFSKHVEQLSQDFWGREDVKKIRLTSGSNKGAMAITHLRLRNDGDDGPYLDESLLGSKEGILDAVKDLPIKSEGWVKAEILGGEESEGSEGFFNSISHSDIPLAPGDGQLPAPSERLVGHQNMACLYQVGSERLDEHSGMASPYQANCEVGEALSESLCVKETENSLTSCLSITGKPSSLHSTLHQQSENPSPSFTVSEALAIEGHQQSENPSPTFSLCEAKAMLNVLRSLPSRDAKEQIASKVILPAIDALGDAAVISEMVEELAKAMEAEIVSDPNGAPWHRFPHYDINASVETKKNAALRVRNALLKAKNYGQLCNVIYQAGSAAFAWVADRCLSQADRETIWDTLKTWLNSLEAKQLNLFEGC